MAVPLPPLFPFLSFLLQLRLAMKCKLQRKVCVGHASMFNCHVSFPTRLCLLLLTRLRGFSFLDFCLFVTRRKKKPSKHPRSKSLAVTVTRRLPFSKYHCLSLSLLPYLTSFLYVWQTFSPARPAIWQSFAAADAFSQF